MDDLDIDKSKIYLDGIDITKDANIGKYHLTYVPEKINQGLHEIKIHFYSLTGLQYNPIRWFFTVSTQDIIDLDKISITQSGRLSTNLTIVAAGTVLIAVVLLITSILLYSLVSVVRERK